MTLYSLINAVPVPKIRTDSNSELDDPKTSSPKAVQVICRWLGLPKKCDVLKDILEVSTMIKNIQKNNKKLLGNYLQYLVRELHQKHVPLLQVMPTLFPTIPTVYQTMLITFQDSTLKPILMPMIF